MSETDEKTKVKIKNDYEQRYLVLIYNKER